MTWDFILILVLNAVNFFLSTVSNTTQNLICCMLIYIQVNFSFDFASDFPFDPWITSMCVVQYPSIWKFFSYLSLISSLIPLQWENILYDFNSLKFVGDFSFIVQYRIGPLLVTLPYVLEKDVYSGVLGKSSLTAS